MQYLFLIYADPERLANATPEQIAEAMEAHRGIQADASSRGALLGASRLTPPSEAFTIRADNGTAITTDGPYAETKEVVGGYYLMECADANEARQWAQRMSGVGAIGAIEVRALRSS